MNKKIKLDPNDKTNIFNTVMDLVIGSGGDGAGLILCKYFDNEDLANYFENMFENWTFPWKKEKRENCTIFSNDQEYVIIADKDTFEYGNEMFEIKIEI